MPLATETVTIGSCSHQKLPLKGQLALSHSIQLHGEHTGAPPALEVGVVECETEGLEAQHFAKKNWLPNSPNSKCFGHIDAHKRISRKQPAFGYQKPTSQCGCLATLAFHPKAGVPKHFLMSLL